MAIPTINDIAGIIDEPSLRLTGSGTPILNFRLAFNDSKYNDQTKSWENSKTFYVDAQVWEQAAERLAETLNKGDQVYVQGRIETQSWEKDGEKKSKPVLNARTVRKLEKPQGNGNGNGGQQQAQRPAAQQPAQDPWGQTEPPF